jgi:hypothetical protein
MKTHEEITAEMLSSAAKWPGGALCVKKYPRGDEKAGFMGYAAFGVVTVPFREGRRLVVYLRPNLETFQTYDSVDAAIADGWVVD